MSELPELVKDLALILVVAGIVTLLFKRLKQPLVLGYIVAGFLVSPHMPYIMSVVDRADVQTWADIGVIFLLFSLGLDFSFKKILKMGAAPVIAVSTIIFSMMFLGISAGRLFGWAQMDCLFLGGMLAMSSTTIIYKAFDDMGLRQQQFTGLVMSVLILEDVLAIVMMVMLSAIAQGSNPDGGQMLASVVRIIFFLVLWFVVGIFLIPAFLRRCRPLINEEVLLVVSLGLCCLMAVISTTVGFSSAFGAFVMGSILAETVEADKIIRLVEPVKNLFGAIFFVSVGMLVDPGILVRYALPIAVIVLTILVGQAVLGSFGYLLSGQTLRTAMRCGFSMAQIGEFAFIIASLGLSLGVVSQFLYPVVVAVSVITTFLTPYMIRFATPSYMFINKHLPNSWITALNHITLSHPQSVKGTNNWQRLLVQMFRNTMVYSILSVAVIMLMLTFFLPFVRRLMPGWEMHWWANAICGTLTILFISPFLRAMVMKKNHSPEYQALWAESRLNHLPLLFTILVRVVIACMFIFYVANYLSRFSNALIITMALALVILMVLSRQLKHSSIRLERLFIQNLRSRDIEAQVNGRRRPLYEGHLLDRDVHIADLEVPSDSKWMGKTLRELALRNRFGVHVSSILRANRRINIPDGQQMIFPGDRLQAIGSDEQLTRMGEALTAEVYSNDPDLEKREMRLHQMILSGSSPFVGKTLQESGIRNRYNCMVVGLEEGKENLSSISPDRQFRKGDIIWVVGELESLRQLDGSRM
ncbi:MAG: cation:proton antiporter [Prevotella sp.]|nr:cation:proton antiporter [Prevotella sp.]